MKNYIYKKLLILIAICIVFYGFAADVSADISDEKIDEALKVLSDKLGEEIITKEQAAQKCDSNDVKILEICKTVGEQFNAYSKEEQKLVNSFVAEVKASIANEIKNCETAECLIETAQKLADRFSKKSPDVASKLDLTKKIVDDKKALIETIKSENVSLEECRSLDPNIAPTDTVRKCFNAQKKILREQKFNNYISEEFKNREDFEDKIIELREGLANGSIDCGGAKSLDACGQYCLNPSTEARTQGASSIPAVCRSIAQRFFGAKGIKHLEQAYTHVRATKEFHLQKYENLSFTTADGETLTNPEDIGKYCQEQSKNGNIAEARKCLDFGKENGFISEEEEEFAQEFLEHANTKGNFKEFFEKCAQNLDFDECQQFMPEKEKARFQKFKEIENIIKESFGFDPRECQNRDCSQGAEKALSRLESLNSQNPEVQRMIKEMKENLARAKRFSEHKDDLNKIFQQHGRCSTPQECHAYCSEPKNSAECIAAGSKTNIFESEEAVRKYEELYRNTRGNLPGSNVEFPGQGPFPDFRPPGLGGQIPSQVEGVDNGPRSQQASEECKRAIESGDFEGAKRLCNFEGPRVSPRGTLDDYPKNDEHRKRMCHERGGTWFEGYCKFPQEHKEQPSYSPQMERAHQCPQDSYWDPRINNCRRPEEFRPKPNDEFRLRHEERTNPTPPSWPTEQTPLPLPQSPLPGEKQIPPPTPTSGLLQLLRANFIEAIKILKLWQ